MRVEAKILSPPASLRPPRGPGGAGAKRRALLARCAGLFDEAKLVEQPDGWVGLSGRLTAAAGALSGRTATVSLMAEALGWRRLPQLWLSLTIAAPLPVRGALDIVRRPGNIEFYAPAADLPLRLDAPDGLPPDSLIKGSGDAAATLERLAAPLRELLAEPRVKEILVTRRGARLTIQLREGQKSAYLLLRQTLFDLEPVAAQELSAFIGALERAIAPLLPPAGEAAA